MGVTYKLGNNIVHLAIRAFNALKGNKPVVDFPIVKSRPATKPSFDDLSKTDHLDFDPYYACMIQGGNVHLIGVLKYFDNENYKHKLFGGHYEGPLKERLELWNIKIKVVGKTMTLMVTFEDGIINGNK